MAIIHFGEVGGAENEATRLEISDPGNRGRSILVRENGQKKNNFEVFSSSSSSSC